MRGGKLKLCKSFLCHKVYQKEKEKFLKVKTEKAFFKNENNVQLQTVLILEKKQKIISTHDKIKKIESLYG